MRVLQHTGGNQLQAASSSASPAAACGHKIRALGITIERAVWSDDDTAE